MVKISGKQGIGDGNNNGKRFVDFCTASSLVAHCASTGLAILSFNYIELTDYIVIGSRFRNRHNTLNYQQHSR